MALRLSPNRPSCPIHRPNPPRPRAQVTALKAAEATRWQWRPAHWRPAGRIRAGRRKEAERVGTEEASCPLLSPPLSLGDPHFWPRPASLCPRLPWGQGQGWGPVHQPPTELERRVAFHREQLGHVEKKNAEMYKVSSQQFHEAASKMETAVKPRGLEPVCSGLQAQILRCYGDHAREVLLCSELVKAYRRCVTVSVTHKG
nr:MICOS complex subunit MIC25 [Microcebus murinus]